MRPTSGGGSGSSAAFTPGFRRTLALKSDGRLEEVPVQANGLVDHAISRQTGSEAGPSADTTLAGSPPILNRQVSTSLTRRDGGSLLMGGLISGNQSAVETGVPVRLFRTDAVQEDRTELMVMATPCVIADHEEWLELTRRIREQLDLHTEASAMRRSGMGVRLPGAVGDGRPAGVRGGGDGG